MDHQKEVTPTYEVNTFLLRLSHEQNFIFLKWVFEDQQFKTNVPLPSTYAFLVGVPPTIY